MNCVVDEVINLVLELSHLNKFLLFVTPQLDALGEDINPRVKFQRFYILESL